MGEFNLKKPSFIGSFPGWRRTHFIVQPFGHPIMLCMWELRPEVQVEEGEKKPTYARCLAILSGKVSAPMGYKFDCEVK